MSTTQELKTLIEEINKMNGETTLKILEMYDSPELLYGHLNNRDHLIDQALVKQGKMTQEEANKKYIQRTSNDEVDKLMREMGIN